MSIQPRHPAPLSNEEPIEILLVDDRPENLLALVAVLERPEYQLTTASSGEEALRYLLSHDPALILLDVQMPGMDGFETASLIKQRERSREIPIIFITAINKDERYIYQGYSGGAVDYIQKPFDSNILRAKVGVFADLYRKTRRLVQAERRIREAERIERENRVRDLELKALKREQAEKQRFLDLAEGINNGIVWSANPESLALSYVSPSAQRILGFPVDRWYEEESFWKSHLHDADRDRFLSTVAQVRETKQPASVEHRFISADGHLVWLHTNIRYAKRDESALGELRALSVDVTRLKEAEESLRRRKERSDFMAEASLLLSESLDQQSLMDRVSRLATQSLADWCLIEVFDPSGALRSHAFAHRNDPADSGILKRIAEFRAAHPAGPRILAEGKASLFTDGPDEALRSGRATVDQAQALRNLGTDSHLAVPLVARGRVVGMMGLGKGDSTVNFDAEDLATAEDLARRIALSLDNAILYAQSQEAIHARDEFLSIASHELRTPLTPLKLHTQGMMRSIKKSLTTGAPMDADSVSRLVEVSERQIGRLTRLIEDLLDISRINIGRLKLEIEEFDLSELVHEVLERFKEELKESRCTVTLDMPEKLMVCLDRNRIEQVFVNLMTNAIKYGAGKPIEIRLAHQGDRAVVEVRDHGIGIDKKDQERIFQRFERAVSASNFGGLGLGLYIVSQILEAHGGHISVESTPGLGAKFTVNLPERAKAQVA